MRFQSFEELAAVTNDRLTLPILARCPRFIVDEDSQALVRDPYVSVFRGVEEVVQKGCVKRELDKPVNDVSAEVGPLSKRPRWARGVLH